MDPRLMWFGFGINVFTGTGLSGVTHKKEALALFQVFKAGVKNLFDAAQFGVPGGAHVVETRIHVGPEVAKP